MTTDVQMVKEILFGSPNPHINVRRTGSGYLLKISGCPDGISFNEMDALLTRQGFISFFVDFRHQTAVYRGDWSCPDCPTLTLPHVKQTWSAVIGANS